MTDKELEILKRFRISRLTDAIEALKAITLENELDPEGEDIEEYRNDAIKLVRMCLLSLKSWDKPRDPT